MSTGFNALLQLLKENARSFSGRDANWAQRLPRTKTPATYNNFTLFFYDHARHPIGRIIDLDSGKSFEFTDIRKFGQRAPAGAEPVFTAFPRMMYVLETAQSEWTIYGRDQNGKARTVMIETRSDLPADPGQIHRDVPPQMLGKN